MFLHASAYVHVTFFIHYNSNTSNLSRKSLGTVPSTAIAIDITVILFFLLPRRSKSICSFIVFGLWKAKSTKNVLIFIVFIFRQWPGKHWFNPWIESYQRLKKWYLMPPCLTLSIIRYGSRVKWGNPGIGVASPLTPWCSSYRKESLRVTLDYCRQLSLLYYKVWSSGQD